MSERLSPGTGWIQRLRFGPEQSPKWLVLIAACTGLAMLMIDTFVVNVALAAIGRDLDASLDMTEWTVSGYVLTTGVLPIATGRLGDIFGRRRLFLWGLLIFTLASTLCGAAGSVEQLVLFRVLQGVGAATMMPGTLSLITQAFPAHQRGLAIGIWGGVSGLGLIAGPIIGGLLVHGDSWRAIFYVNLPVGALALLLTALFVPESRDEGASRTLDWRGLALLCGALGLIMVSVTRGNALGWDSPAIIGGLAGGLALLPVFVVVERRVRAPLVDLSLFRNTTFVMACVSSFLFSATVFGSQPFASLFMQNYWGFTPLQGGFAFLPATAIVATMMPVSGILGGRLGPRLRLLVITGSLCVAASSVLLLRLDLRSTYASGFLPSFVLRGFGIGLVSSSTSLAVMSAVPLAKSGLASGTSAMARNVGTAMGVALFGAVFTQHVNSELPRAIADMPPAVVASTTERADHFIPSGGPEVRPQAERAILDGFIRISAVGVGLSLVATFAAFFIRHRLAPVPAPTKSIAVTPNDARPVERAAPLRT